MDNKTLNGTLGEISVVKRLIFEGWDIFLPINGKTEFDIIAYKPEYGLVSIQVKSTTQKTPYGSYEVGLRSIRSNKTENITHLFNNKIQNILAVYIVEIDAAIFYISNNISSTSSICIKQLDAINKQEITLTELMDTLAESA